MGVFWGYFRGVRKSPIALKELQVKPARANERSYKLADWEDLFLPVRPDGSKLWCLKYRFAGKEKLLSFGVYPEVGSSAAKELRPSAKRGFG